LLKQGGLILCQKYQSNY